MKRLLHKTLFLLSAVWICVLCCSCATALTVHNLGRESFRWQPKEMQVSIHTATDSNFMEQKTVYITKKGSLREYRLPYDFYRRFPSEWEVTRTVAYPVKGNIPVFAVKVEDGAKPVMNRLRYDLVSTNDSRLNYSYAGFVESVRPYKVSPEDFLLLQKPFWFCCGKNDWSLCVPMKPIKMDDYYHIPTMIIHPGGERNLPPEEIRDEERYWNGFGINTARVLCSIIPFAFDIATFPIQLIVFVFV